MALVAFLPAMVLGWMIVRLLCPAGSKPGWLRFVTEISLGAGLGVGLTSCVFFVLVWAGVASRVSVLACEAAALVGTALLLIRHKSVPQEAQQPGFRWIWVLRGAALLALFTFTLDFSATTGSNPNGEYDAVTIWNLRARYLAGGANTWRYSVSGLMAAGMTGASHPGYPLLNSAFVARTWVIAADNSAAVPAALSFVFALATILLLYSSTGAESTGLLAVLVLLATETFVSQAASQYADIPLGFYILATVVLLVQASVRQWPSGLLALVGMFAGLAAWTKNEGLPFAIIACLVALWRGGRRAGAWVTVAAAPGILLATALKLWLATGGEKMFPATAAEAAKMLVDPSRWVQIATAFARNVWDLGVPWAHPILLLAILAFALGFGPKDQTRSRWWLLLPAAGLLAADFGIYLISTTGLGWHLSTSSNRLIVQIWPGVLFVFFLMVRPPQSLTQAAAVRPTPPKRGRGERA
jgi:hypothetical protein